MNLNVFPPVYNNQLESQAQNDVSSETSQNYQRVNQLNSGRGNEPTIGDWSGGGFCIGLVIGFFVCIGVCNSSGYGDGFGTWVFCAIIGTVLGAVFCVVAKGTYSNNISVIESRIDQSNRDYQNRVSNIQRTKDQQTVEYLKAFENEAQNQSVRLAESELAKDVISWMTDGFCKTINSADRRPHVEQINVPFIFNIFKKKITCNLGTFDFELKRCRELRDPVEQTALARAIASTIQLNLVMKYPKDASGTDISININYSYTNNSVTASITYIAPNGNYQRVKDW